MVTAVKGDTSNCHASLIVLVVLVLGAVPACAEMASSERESRKERIIDNAVPERSRNPRESEISWLVQFTFHH